MLNNAIQNILQYPDWLSKNKEKISESEYNNYTKQKDIIGDILKEFDKEKATDTDDEKNKRFDKIMGLMQRVSTLIALS